LGEYDVATYGSSEPFRLMPDLRHSDVAVCYRDGAATAIISNEFLPGFEHR